MRIIHLFSWLLFIPFCLNLIGFGVVSVSGQCLSDQRSILIQLNSTLVFNSLSSVKIVTWDLNTDCCSWKGVSCSKDGHVIGLDLSSESISGGIENSSSLFSLQHLQSLNLADNVFNSLQIPPEISNLKNLAYLNLSAAGFTGQVPGELSNLTRLVTLDLSALHLSSLSLLGGSSLKLENPNLTMFLRNLNELTELYLDGVNISAQGSVWCQAISSSSPKLRVLSMSNCLLSGVIDTSLAKLTYLSVLRLSQNNLSSSVPGFLASFTNLTVLRLSSCTLFGKFPEKILQLRTLQTLDLSVNGFLSGSLPDFPQNGSLQTLVLSETNFSGQLPGSIANVRMLSRLELFNCSFTGPIPSSMANLSQLVYLDLSSNMFVGRIPSFQKSKNLTHLDLSRNGLSGSVPSGHFEGLDNLVSIDLRYNAFTGQIPSSLFSLPFLQSIQLSNNKFDGLLATFPNSSFSTVDKLDLSSNKLEGPIPKSLFQLTRLKMLSLSYNNLNGSVTLEAFGGLGNLTSLDLSYNNLSVETVGENSGSSVVPQFSTLKLASCKLQYFPNLKNHSKLIYVDLSNNQIGGEIPNWIWEVGSGSLAYLNLSRNQLGSFQQPFDIPSGLSILDLHSNHLQGETLILPQTATYVDYSANQFNCSLPVDIGSNLSVTYFFSVSNNMLSGTIPGSICQATFLDVLDLSYNRLSSKIPSCLIDMNLVILNLGNNNLSGNIPEIFPIDCSLQTLDLHGNLLEGEIPKSLARCSMLWLLNLVKNLLNDTFPCFLKRCTNLKVLSLRSNMLHGDILCIEATGVWPKLQIIDIASNYFTGHVARNFFNSRAMITAMITEEYGEQMEGGNLRFEVLQLNQLYYLDTVAVMNKGLEMGLVKILTIFTAIDISSNRFSGEIPGSIGDLKALYVLNMSHNAFTGSIPASIGKLRQLGSLDLSVNSLAGKIPTELTYLTFLSFLNLSCNRLEGRIPPGSQFGTFTETSFGGNKGLCGFQINISCSPDEPPPSSEEADQKGESIVDVVSVEVGFVVGLATFTAPLVFSKRWSRWYYNHIERSVVTKVLWYYERRNRERRIPIRRLE